MTRTERKHHSTGLFVATILLLALSGCGGPSGDHGPAEPSDADHESTPAADSTQPAPAADPHAGHAHATDTAEQTLDEAVSRAVAVARDIEAGVDSAEEVLRKHGISEEGFEDLLYEISSDAELAKQFSEALGL